MSADIWLKDTFGGFIRSNVLTRFVSLQKITLSGNTHRIATPSSTNELMKLLAEDIHLCPFLRSITLSEYPSNWGYFLSALRIRNCAGLLHNHTSCIQELEFLGALHSIIVVWLQESIQGKLVKTESLPGRQGNPWPVRPVKKIQGFYRSCYLCHISGLELGCQQSETQVVDCRRERGENVTIRII